MHGHADIRLPVGRMVEAPGSIRITLPHGAKTRDAVHSILERLHGIAAEWFWVPTTIDESGSELVLEYLLADADTMPFLAALPRWHASPAEHLPELVELASYLATCTEALGKLELAAAIAPAFLRYGPSRVGAWRMLVVPRVPCSLAEWARASQEAWLWAPPAVLLGNPEDDGAYAIGCALHAALAGPLVPRGIPTNAQFRRALVGRVGMPAQLESAIRAALPPSFSDEATALRDLVIDLLGSPADWRKRLGELARRLSPHRTALRWEYERKAEVARAILERCAATSPPRDVPWEMISRLRGTAHDLEGALDASIAALAAGADGSVRELALIVRRIAGNPTHRHLVERAVTALDRSSERLTDHARLHFAHIEAYYLGRLAEARTRLEAPVKEPWDAVVRAAILARIHAARREWPHLGKLCKETRVVVQAMPSAGGSLGAYMLAYLDHLDGVAHVGASAVYADPGYLADGFAKLVASLEGCADDETLVTANVHWLRRIGEMADNAAIRTGVQAYLSAQPLAERISMQDRREDLAPAWYDAGRLLALSGAP